MASSDLEATKTQFLELRTQQHQILQQLSALNDQAKKRQQLKRRASLTAQEVGSTPEDTRLYKQIGRAYVLTPRSALLEGLESQVVTCDEDTASMEEQGKALEKKLNALKGEMNDLVHAHPAIMKSLREELAA